MLTSSVYWVHWHPLYSLYVATPFSNSYFLILYSDHSSCRHSQAATCTPLYTFANAWQNPLVFWRSIHVGKVFYSECSRIMEFRVYLVPLCFAHIWRTYVWSMKISNNKGRVLSLMRSPDEDDEQILQSVQVYSQCDSVWDVLWVEWAGGGGGKMMLVS